MTDFADKAMTAERAVQGIRSGHHVLVGSGAAEPQLLVEALAARRDELFDVEMLHLLTLGPAPYSGPEFEGHLRHNALFIGPNVRSAVVKGLADYTPCYLSEIPDMIRSGRLRVDAALIQVTPPRDGYCSLGVAVDIVKAAAEEADYVAAQVNARMPWTAGDSRVAMGDIDAFVAGDVPLPELPKPEPTAAAMWIGRNVARLVEDGSTIQAGIGALPDAILAALEGKKDLGVHSEMISDGMLRLIEKGVITGARKTLHPGKAVCSFCLGSRHLYEAAGRPLFEFYPTEHVNDPCVISANERMVAINSALAVDLTGQVAADSVGSAFYSGVGGQVDFIRGAARSKGGKSIIAMPSTAQGGRISRIQAVLPEGTGVVTTRADVDFVVTEFGIASLKGKNIRERALALIGVAHPEYREKLAEDAKRRGYLDPGHILPAAWNPYSSELECRRRFGALEVFFRPLKPSDERRLKDLFYSQSKETTLMRFGIPLRRLSETQFQDLVAIDFLKSMAIGAFAPYKETVELIGVARYYADPDERAAEAAVTVHDDFQGRGIGTFLMNYLAWIALGKGIKLLRCDVVAPNARMQRTLGKCFHHISELNAGPTGVTLSVRLADWKGRGNPALEPLKAAW